MICAAGAALGAITGGSGWGNDRFRFSTEGIVVGARGFLDNAQLCGLGDECPCAVDAVKLLPTVVEGVEELVGGDGLSRIDDFADDVAQGVLPDEVSVLSFRQVANDLVRQVIAIHLEEKFGIAISLVHETPDESDFGKVVLGGY